MPDLPLNHSEINIAVAKRVYGYRWYHVSKTAHGHVYAFVPPEEALADWLPANAPLVTTREGLLVHAVDGLSVGYAFSQSMLHPIANTDHAWRVLRFLAGQHRLRLITTSDEPTPESEGRFAVAFTSRASGMPPVVRVEDWSFERAACAAALALADWSDAKAAREAGANPPAGKDVP